MVLGFPPEPKFDTYHYILDPSGMGNSCRETSPSARHRLGDAFGQRGNALVLIVKA